jgi:hypothetical protein
MRKQNRNMKRKPKYMLWFTKADGVKQYKTTKFYRWKNHAVRDMNFLNKLYHDRYVFFMKEKKDGERGYILCEN